ncbi:hypothetical protein G5B38_02350 [Pseudohalocynthiibacter aestuariivivens]|nr:hypothetical protein [Pseudohalocynthiibacter aestuariivivens]QIE44459.1 hypothetical protein G5B38_02350 [Pseudohalocynthiibacter aestuariivivens]
MACDAPVRFRAAVWSSLVARDLSTIGDCPASDIAIFETEVKSGRWQLYEIEHDGARVGCIVWNAEREGDDIALVINAAACAPIRGVDVTLTILESFRALATATGAKAIRCWTVREGMKRKLERAGAKARYVMEIDLGQ